jgi:hypothetical protein
MSKLALNSIYFGSLAAQTVSQTTNISSIFGVGIESTSRPKEELLNDESSCSIFYAKKIVQTMKNLFDKSASTFVVAE